MNQKVKRDIKDTWLCLQCGERIIPFESGGNAGFVEGVLFLIGLGTVLLFNLFLGLVLIALSVIIGVIRSGGKKKVCPSCESVNIVPATSPIAQKFAKS